VSPVEPSASAKGHGDALLAAKNAAKLGGSLLFTWGIALGVRLALPRYLGPDAFGAVNFSDAFASTAFVLIGLGLDTYIRKEVSVRPEVASDFFAGVTLLRVGLAALLFGGMQLFLQVSGRPPETWILVHLSGLAAFFFTLNQSFGALLHARGTVDGLSVLNIVSKVLWGGGTLATVVLGLPLWCVPAAVALSEALKALGSWYLVQKHLHLRAVTRWPAVKLALLGSAPMFVNTAAHTIYSKLDVSLLALVAGDREVAWYGASSLISGLALMVTPMIGWVLMPLFARARARSQEEYLQVMRRSLELVLTVALPTALFLALGAREWVLLLYGPAYEPATASLQVLAPVFPLTYVAILSANSLIINERAWSQALVSLSGLVVNPFFNWLLIERCLLAFGEGGAGVGAAVAQVGTEVVVTVLMVALMGVRAFDRRSLSMLGRTLAVSLAVWLLDRSVQGLLHPAVRLGLDGVVYTALVFATGALRHRELLDFARSAFRSKSTPQAPAPADPAEVRSVTP
jgi:O-antigen/teichoic acid export membrane protein